LIIAPQKKQQKQHSELLKKLKKNDAVVTIGGIHGVIVNVKEKTVVLRVDDNVKIEIDKSAISHLEKSNA
jgi:preprotein translocase subunit YajC